MVSDYMNKFYHLAATQGRRYAADRHATARTIAAWKAKVRAAWPQVAVSRLDRPPARISFGESLNVEVGVKLAGLNPGDVTVELLLSHTERDGGNGDRRRYALAPQGNVDGSGEARYVLAFTPESCGRLDYRIRAYPRHPDLTHPFEMGLMVWA
jgi:starch phosphorylase